MADLSDIHGRYSKFERAMDAGSSMAFVLNLISPWTDLMQRTSALFIQDRVVDAAIKFADGKQLGKRMTADLARSGIGEAELRAIAAQAQKHAEKVDGLWVGNSSRWTDESASRALSRAVTEDVRRVIVEPHKGELPVWLSSEIGSVIGMFKGFAVASTNRIAIPVLQMRDQQAMSGVVALVAAGFVVDQIRYAQSDMAHVDRPLHLQIGRAIERSGALGYLTDIGRSLDALTAGNFGYGALIGDRGGGKPTDLLGPVYSQGARAANVLWDLGPGDWNSHSSRDLRRLAPLGATAHLDWGFDSIQAFGRMQGAGEYTASQRLSTR
jgi:hypothetical protein